MNVNPNGQNPDPLAAIMAALPPINVNPAQGGQAVDEPPPVPMAAAAANIAHNNPFAPDALAQPVLAAPDSPPQQQILQAPQDAPGAPRRAQGLRQFAAPVERRILNFDAIPEAQPVPFHLQHLPVPPHLLAMQAAQWLGLIQPNQQPQPSTPSGASTGTQIPFTPPSVNRP